MVAKGEFLRWGTEYHDSCYRHVCADACGRGLVSVHVRRPFQSWNEWSTLSA